MLKLSVLSFAACLLCFGQRPAGMGRGPGGGMGGREWWENPIINNLNLSEAQRKQIQTTTRDFRNRLVDARAAMEKAEGDLQDVFNDATADERRANDQIDRVVRARGELLKVVTQMSWKLRAVLTAEQWQELRRRPPMGPPFGLDAAQSPGAPGRNPGRRLRVPGNPPPPQPAKPPVP